MFGYIVGNMNTMDKSDQERYRAAYCGLCREIGRRSGQLSRLTLTYDLTFLILLLSSLYEPDGFAAATRCVVHPLKRHAYFSNRFTEYAADMNVYLACRKADDDGRDEHKPGAKLLSRALVTPCRAIEARFPRQCDAIKSELHRLTEIEQSAAPVPDEALNCFGRLMGELFVINENDYFAESLRRFGRGLGRFVYLIDATLDYDKDKKNGSFNPLTYMEAEPSDMRGALTMLIGEAAKEFERLPLEQDLTLLRGILYGGVWQHYNKTFPMLRQETDLSEQGGAAVQPPEGETNA